MQYHFYLKGCSYASSTFTIVLGLGQGGGTDKLGYVDGYAFFDDVECRVISAADYDETVDALIADGSLDEEDIAGTFTETRTSASRRTRRIRTSSITRSTCTTPSPPIPSTKAN